MLKIRDDVDLKKLEKFGFKTNSKGQYVKKYTIICKNRTIMGLGGTQAHSKVHLAEELYDLIQANLIEKVEG